MNTTHTMDDPDDTEMRPKGSCVFAVEDGATRAQVALHQQKVEAGAMQDMAPYARRALRRQAIGSGRMTFRLPGVLRGLVSVPGIVLVFGLALTALVRGDPAQPFADIHTHYNWDQVEVISADEVARKLEREKVAFTVVAGTPSRLALRLKEAGGDRVVPFFSPYIHPLGRRDWFLGSKMLEQAEAGLRQGLYQGIGEVHFMRGFRPKTDNAVFLRLMQLARQYDVPVLVHLDAGGEQPFLDLCLTHHDVRLLFAHAGGNLYPEHIRRILQECDNVLVEFSARDPWRYGGLTGEDGLLLPGWRRLVLDFPDRFATGTDPVWRVTRTQSWDEPDEGWDHFEELLAYHRKWLGDLPPDVEERVRLTNASRFLRITVEP